jgi:hypothetical protein
MGLLDAFRHAMRMRRTGPVDLDAAGRWAAGETPGPEHRGLADLLAAAGAPADATDPAGRQAAVAAFAAAGRDEPVVAAFASAGLAGTAPEQVSPRRRSRTARALTVNVTAAVVLLAGTGAALAARGGHLPDAVQQRAHDLFSRLGVPAPDPSPDSSDVPGSRPRPSPSRPAERPSPVPPPAAMSPSAPSAPVAPAPAGWCRAWAADPESGDTPWYRKLVEAAGSEDEVAAYCAGLGSPRAASAKPEHSRKPPGRPSDPPTPSHPGKK